MSLLKRLNPNRIDKFISIYRHFSSEKAIVDSRWAETALTKVQGKLYPWVDAYEDFVGLTEVKYAQEQVTQVRFICTLKHKI